MIINLFDLEKKFPEKVSEKIADYYGSGARDEITLHRNKSIFSKYELLPKLLRDVSAIDTSCNILGLEIDKVYEDTKTLRYFNCTNGNAVNGTL